MDAKEKLDSVGQTAILMVALSSLRVAGNPAVTLIEANQIEGRLVVRYVPTGQAFEIVIKEK